MRNFKIFITVSFFVIIILPIVSIAFLMNEPEAAYAESVVLSYAECTDFDGETVAYDTDNPVYARDVRLHFTIASPYYTVVVYNKNGVEINRIWNQEPSGGEALYAVSDNGELTVRCYAVDENFQNVNYCDVPVKSDNLAPDAVFITEMEGWTRFENGFLVQINTGEDNGNSGIKRADISINYENETVQRSIVSPMYNDSFAIYDICTIIIDIYDNVGNVLTSEYDFDKFDSTPPASPTFVLTPNVPSSAATNFYVKEYYVTINYGEDKGSGIQSGSMEYTVNGQLYDYTGGFYLNEMMIYTITAHYKDNAGNTSAVVTEIIDNIERLEPVILTDSISLKVDLTKENPYTLNIICRDNNSGIKSINVQGLQIDFVKSLYDVYIGNFHTLDLANLNITVTDNVGNFKTASILTHHFGDIYKEETAVEYNQAYLALDRNLYSDIGWDDITAAYTNLNLLFMSEESTQLQFTNATAAIDEAILGEIEYSYKINSVPTGLSTKITYEINNEDITNLKKGDSIELTLDDIAGETSVLDGYKTKASSLCDFTVSIARLFKLTFLHNDAEITYSFLQGAEISMAVPFGYEARYFKVVNLSTDKLIECEVINNSINFVVNSGGNYAIVIEGGDITADTAHEEISGFTIFGKTISWTYFALALTGVVIFAVLMIVIISIRYKKNNLR